MEQARLRAEGDAEEEAAAVGGNGGGGRGERKLSVGKRFLVQLDQLTSKIDATKSHYVRCLKANAAKKPAMFDAPMVHEQML